MSRIDGEALSDALVAARCFPQHGPDGVSAHCPSCGDGSFRMHFSIGNDGAVVSELACSSGHDEDEILTALAPHITRPLNVAAAASAGLNVVKLSTVVAEPVSWLWKGRVPLGKFTLLSGDPGLGKSQITLDIAARVTTGRSMPDGTPGPSTPAPVVLVVGEDGLADTVRPRIEAAGGNSELVHVVNVATEADGHERSVSIPGDLERIKNHIVDVGAPLVVVDPLNAFLGGKVDVYRDHDVRLALGPLAQIAEETSTAVLCVGHLNKGDGAAMYRPGGSIGIIAQARVAMLCARDPDNAEAVVMAVVKSNIHRPAPSLSFRVADVSIEGAGSERIDTSKIEWLGESSYDANGLLAANNPGRAASEGDPSVRVREVLAARIVRHLASQPGHAWEGQAKDLLPLVTPASDHLPHAWPTKPEGLRALLTRMQEPLALAGVSVRLPTKADREPGTGRRLIRLSLDLSQLSHRHSSASDADDEPMFDMRLAIRPLVLPTTATQPQTKEEVCS